MAWTFNELEQMSIKELQIAYDERHTTEIETREFILDEISRRNNIELTERIVDLTKTIKNLTWAIFLLTILNLVLVSINFFPN